MSYVYGILGGGGGGGMVGDGVDLGTRDLRLVLGLILRDLRLVLGVVVRYDLPARRECRVGLLVGVLSGSVGDVGLDLGVGTGVGLGSPTERVMLRGGAMVGGQHCASRVIQLPSTSMAQVPCPTISAIGTESVPWR